MNAEKLNAVAFEGDTMRPLNYHINKNDNDANIKENKWTYTKRIKSSSSLRSSWASFRVITEFTKIKI